MEGRDRDENGGDADKEIIWIDISTRHQINAIPNGCYVDDEDGGSWRVISLYRKLQRWRVRMWWYIQAFKQLHSVLVLLWATSFSVFVSSDLIMRSLPHLLLKGLPHEFLSLSTGSSNLEVQISQNNPLEDDLMVQKTSSKFLVDEQLLTSL